MSAHVTGAFADDANVPSKADLEFFEKHIRPVLVTKCYQCHSAAAAKEGKLKGGLALDTRAGVLQGGDSGAALVPGKPEQSLLLAALRYEDYEMPPEGKLPAETIKHFATWIARGAADPRDGDAVVAKPTIDFAAAREFWSLRPLTEVPLPQVKEASWPHGEIDQFVLAKLEEQKLVPLADASPRVLVRRIYFDLLGLPPTPEQMENFVQAAAKNRAEATAVLVDELLASPHFGERWGRHWLDVVRYAESNGRDVNVVWYDAWRYRDWVIAAFNNDLPFDDFVRQQIAGDLLPAASPEQRDWQTIATGMLAMTPKMIGELNKNQFQMDTIDDQIEVIGRAFLGLSISCARCHDHKFDPIPTADYYALAGILRSSEPLYGFGRIGVKNSPHTELIPIGPDAEELGQSALEYRQDLVARNETFQSARSARYRVVRNVADAKLKLEKPSADKEKLTADIVTMEAEIADWDAKIKQMEDDLKELRANPPPQPDWAMGVREAAQVADCRIHIRGEVGNLGESVPRGVLQVIDLKNAEPIEPKASGRLQLANWLADDANPLTPRVAVNRVWLHLMGRGLVDTTDDFGVTGTAPSHPELLNHLAHTFVTEGWSIKQLVRRIVLSRTYQLAAFESSPSYQSGMAQDPGNIYYWHRRPRRMTAEEFRDTVMCVAGRLEDSPPEQAFLTQWNRYEEDQIKSSKPFLTPDMLEDNHRSVYLPVLRGVLPEVFELFDFADPNRVVGRREESTVPAQALFLMNSPWMIERGTWTAERMLATATSDADRVDQLFLLAFGRAPADNERLSALEYLAGREQLAKPDEQQVPPEELEKARWVSFCQAVLTSSEFRYIP